MCTAWSGLPSRPANGSSAIASPISTRAYQGAAGGVDISKLMQLEALTHGDVQPDLTLILDLDPVSGRERIAARATSSADGLTSVDPFEARDLSFQCRLREAFLEIAGREPARCQIIDASQCPDDVEEAIWAAVCERLGVGPG